MITPVKLGVVGLHFGQAVIDTMLLQGAGAPFFRVAAVCDLDEARLATAVQKTGATGYREYRNLLADPEIPALALFTGPAGRADLIRQALRAGKHVLTTKPFERDAVQALAVLREAQQLGLAVHLNSPGPTFPPNLLAIRRWQQEHDLGRIIGCRADTWTSYHEQPDGTWYDDQQRCPVAPVFRIGIYLINDLVNLMGAAESVTVLQSRIRTGRPTADNAQLGIRFSSGALANIFASFCVDDGDSYRYSLVLNFERGTVYRNSGPVRSPDQQVQTELSLVQHKNGQRTRVAYETFPTDCEDYQWEVFWRAVTGVPVKTDITPEQIAMGVRIVEAMAAAEAANGTATVTPLV